MLADIREVVWVVGWEDIVIVIGEVDGEGLTFWLEITSRVEEMLGIEASTDETCKVVILSGDDETAEVFSVTGNDIEMNEGICNGILKTGGTSNEGMGIYTKIGVIYLGRQVAFW